MTCFDSALFSSSTDDDDDDGIDRGELIDQKIIPNVPERCVVLCRSPQRTRGRKSTSKIPALQKDQS
jgi:hypothetical protein